MSRSPVVDQEMEQQEGQGKLGTFAGVFTPSILTILGIILFLRLGYVTGSAGFGRALLILLIANLVTIITSQSLSAVATNLKVKGGGDYYLISRTLGYKFGGSIGIVLFLAQSVSVAFYCIGFAEALTSMNSVSLPPQVVASLAVLCLFALAWLGADWATRFQFVVMGLLVLALFSFIVGGVEKWQLSTLLANWEAPQGSPPFWLIFAVFFPAVTGFTQGVSMSGDLKDPGKSLPRGTFSAVALSIVVYFVIMLLFAGAMSNEGLVEDYQAMKHLAKFGVLIDAGVIAATLSSAMASFMGGPRILQSLAADRIFPVLNGFARGDGPGNNPRRCVLLTGAIALATISLGQLNLIAQIVSMFFLISYGLLNYATYFEADTGSSSFRPRFSFFNKYVSLAGCILCLGIMLALDPESGMVALLVMFGFFLYLRKSAQPARWADSTRSHAIGVIRRNLEKMIKMPEHQRDWYPHFIVFTKRQETREKILRAGDWLGGKIELMTAVSIIEGTGVACRVARKQEKKQLDSDLASLGLLCYGQVICAENFSSTMNVYLQAQGFGPLKPNSILVNWRDGRDSSLSGLEMLKFGHNLRSAYHLGFNLVIFHCSESKWQSLNKKEKTPELIDVWWQGEDDSGRLMLLFAYLMTKNNKWKNAKIRVLATDMGEGLEETRAVVEHLFDEARIPAQAQVVADLQPETVLEYSQGADWCFLPFRIRDSRIVDVNGYSLERVLGQLPPTALVMAAQEIDLDAEPEEGAAGELAKAMDVLYAEEKRLKSSQQEEKKHLAHYEELVSRMEKQGISPDVTEGGEGTGSLAQQCAEAEKVKEKNFRRVARAKARYEEALREVEKRGGRMEKEEGK